MPVPVPVPRPFCSAALLLLWAGACIPVPRCSDYACAPCPPRAVRHCTATTVGPWMDATQPPTPECCGALVSRQRQQEQHQSGEPQHSLPSGLLRSSCYLLLIWAHLVFGALGLIRRPPTRAMIDCQMTAHLPACLPACPQVCTTGPRPRQKLLSAAACPLAPLQQQPAVFRLWSTPPCGCEQPSSLSTCSTAAAAQQPVHMLHGSTSPPKPATSQVPCLSVMRACMTDR